MAIDPGFVACLNQTIYVAAKSAKDRGGAVTYGAPVARSAYQEPQDKVIHNAAGEELSSDTFLVTEATIGKYDRIWLSGLDQTNADLARHLKTISEFRGEDGTIHHYEIDI